MKEEIKNKINDLKRRLKNPSVSSVKSAVDKINSMINDLKTELDNIEKKEVADAQELENKRIEEFNSKKNKIESDIDEMQILIELTEDTLSQNPKDEDLSLYLELLKETLQSIKSDYDELLKSEVSNFGNGGNVKNKDRVDTVLRNYLATSLWSSTDSENDDTPFDRDYNVDDFDINNVERVRGLIINFLIDNESDLKQSGLNDEQIGHDLWLTQTGHGSGFWDRGLDKELGDRLSEASKKLGQSAYVYAQDGKVYIDGLSSNEKMKDGGNVNLIPNNYEGKTPKEIWDAWSVEQRTHFLIDHSEIINSKNTNTNTQINAPEWATYLYSELPIEIQESLNEHKFEGQYSKGGYVNLKEHGIILLEGEETIDGQIQAREKALESVMEELKKENSNISITQLEGWKNSHINELNKLYELKKSNDKIVCIN